MFEDYSQRAAYFGETALRVLGGPCNVFQGSPERVSAMVAACFRGSPLCILGAFATCFRGSPQRVLGLSAQSSGEETHQITGRLVFGIVYFYKALQNSGKRTEYSQEA